MAAAIFFLRQNQRNTQQILPFKRDKEQIASTANEYPFAKTACWEFPKPLSIPRKAAVGTLFENAKLIFPLRAVETASAAIFITSGTAGLKAVKSRLLLHEQFKRPPFAVCEIHSGCASFPAGIKKPQTFDLWRGNMQKGTLSCDNAPFARLFSCNLFARCP